MTADEIRADLKSVRDRVDSMKSVEELTASLLAAQMVFTAEIAAQLAELNGHPISIEREPTAEAIVKATDYEFNLDQARRMVDLVSRNAVRS